MIDRGHKLPLIRQTEAVGISRGSLYYWPRSGSDADLGLMRRIDKLHLDYPFAGSRMMRDLLRQDNVTGGLALGRQACFHIDAANGRQGVVPETKHQSAPPRSTRVSVPATRTHGDQAQPGMGYGHHVHTDGPGICVPGRRDGLVQP